MHFFSTSHETVASGLPSAHSVSCRLRLQFPFVFRQLHSLQMLGLALPFPFRFVSSASLHFSGIPLSRPIAASVSLSDPRCFRFLSSASVLGSDYSASVSSFLLSSRFCLTAAFFGAPSLSFRPFPFSPGWFPIRSFRFCLLGSAVLVSFRPSLLRSHSRSTGAPFIPGSFPPRSFRFRPFRFASFRPLPLPFLSYSAFSLFRSASSLARLAPARSVPLRFFRRSGFPLPSGLVSHSFSPVPLTWFSASFPFVLPDFAPAAVPPVLVPLPFVSSVPLPVSPCFRFLSSASV